MKKLETLKRKMRGNLRIFIRGSQKKRMFD